MQEEGGMDVIETLPDERADAADPARSIVALDTNSEFEEQIREQTRLRRQRQDADIAQLNAQVERLSAALAAESKRRVAACQRIELECKEQLQTFEEKAMQQLRSEQAKVHTRIGLLENRLISLERRWEEQVNSVQTEMTEAADSLQKGLKEWKQLVATEKKEQVDRQEAWTTQFQEVSQHYDEKWTKERQERLADLHALNDRLDSQDHVREEQLRAFEHKVRQEIEALGEEIDHETTERSRADQDILDGLNRYVEQLQKSLKFVSGV